MCRAQAVVVKHGGGGWNGWWERCCVERAAPARARPQSGSAARRCDAIVVGGTVIGLLMIVLWLASGGLAASAGVRDRSATRAGLGIPGIVYASVASAAALRCLLGQAALTGVEWPRRGSGAVSGRAGSRSHRWVPGIFSSRCRGTTEAAGVISFLHEARRWRPAAQLSATVCARLSAAGRACEGRMMRQQWDVYVTPDTPHRHPCHPGWMALSDAKPPAGSPPFECGVEHGWAWNKAQPPAFRGASHRCPCIVHIH